MKCVNPKCPDPSVVESLPVQSSKFCPACGSRLVPSLKSPENDQSSEKRSQTEEEGAKQSSLKQSKT